MLYGAVFSFACPQEPSHFFRCVRAILSDTCYVSAFQNKLKNRDVDEIAVACNEIVTYNEIKVVNETEIPNSKNRVEIRYRNL